MRLKSLKRAIPAVTAAGLLSGGIYAAETVHGHAKDTKAATSCEAYTPKGNVRPNTVQALAALILTDYSDPSIPSYQKLLETTPPLETRTVISDGTPNSATDAVRAKVTIRPLSTFPNQTSPAANCFGALHDITVETTHDQEKTDYVITPAGIGRWTIAATTTIGNIPDGTSMIDSTLSPTEFEQALNKAESAVENVQVVDPGLQLTIQYLAQ